MSIAAVPKYLGSDFKDMPPGHRFGTFFPVWSERDWSRPKDDVKTKALKSVLEFSAFKSQIEALGERQKSLAETLGDNLLSVPALSISPFMSGTGMEHPLENGFAFLSPYGLPYLPGSSVKGVLRQTARLLAAGEFNDQTHGWSQAVIDIFFGLESEDGNGTRGALLFWDVLIEPKDCKLGMDILTPHYGEYYAGNSTPHDSGSPKPVPFLVVPSGANFCFYVQCQPCLINEPELRENWRSLVQVLLEHAFEWLGFGAKTAGGYGQLNDKRNLEIVEGELAKERLAKSGITLDEQAWENAVLHSRDPGAGNYIIKDLDTGGMVTVKNTDYPLSEQAKKRFKKKKKVYFFVRVEQQGNQLTVIELEEK